MINVDYQINLQVRDQAFNSAILQINEQVYRQLRKKVWWEVQNLIWDIVHPYICGQIRDQINE